MTVAKALAACLATLVLAGCSSNGATDQAKPSPSPTETPAPIARPSGECFDAPCPLSFLKEAPTQNPSVTLHVAAVDPFEIRVEASGLGEPKDWLLPPAEEATVFAVYISDSDDNPTGGGQVCLLDENLACERGVSIPTPSESGTYNRITVLALKDATTDPTLQDGFARLVATRSFGPGFQARTGR